MVAPSSLMRTQLSLNRLLHSPLFTQIIHHRAPNPSIRRHRGDLSGWLSNRVQQHPFARSRVFSSPFSSSSSSKKKKVGVGLGRNGVGFIVWYLEMVKSRPVLTKSFTCSIIYTAADLSSQTLSLPSSEPYDFVRTARMAGYGLLIIGPTLHLWFNFMSKILPGRDLLTTTKKMVLGQTVYGPVMTAVFFSLNSALQGENGGEIIARLKRDFVPTLVNGAMYWPLCDFITFRFIPVHLQPLVSNSFSYLWTVYMTYMASLEKASPE
ncbi:hypothetical protein Drorol1_Dr00006968 [Drosera rotundifolia]